MTEMVKSGSMSGQEKRSDGLLGEEGNERRSSATGAAGPVRHRAPARLYQPISDIYEGSGGLVVGVVSGVASGSGRLM